MSEKNCQVFCKLNFYRYVIKYNRKHIKHTLFVDRLPVISVVRRSARRGTWTSTGGHTPARNPTSAISAGPDTHGKASFYYTSGKCCIYVNIPPQTAIRGWEFIIYSIN